MLTRVRLATVNRSECPNDLWWWSIYARPWSNLVQNNIDIKTPVTNPVHTCGGGVRRKFKNEQLRTGPEVIFMDCIFMDFGLEKRLLGGLGRKSKNESSGGGVCSTIIPLTVVFNYSFRLLGTSSTARSISLNIYPISVRFLSKWELVSYSNYLYTCFVSHEMMTR